MEKIKIQGRTNWEGGFYLRLKSEEKAMRVIKKIIEELGSDYFVDNHVIPKTLSKYEKWKDYWIPLYEEKIEADIICGDKIIHMIVHRCGDFDFINNLFHKYCIWIEPKKVKPKK